MATWEQDEERLRNQLIRLYERAEADIVRSIERMARTGKKQAQALGLLKKQKREVEGILGALRKRSKAWARTAAESAYGAGIDVADEQLRHAGIRLRTGLGEIHRKAVEVFAEKVYSRLGDVVTLSGRTAVDIYRAASLEASMIGAVEGYETWQQARQKILDEVTGKGIVGFVDRAGKRWSMKTYAEMLARTVLMEIHNEAQWREFRAHDEDLIAISFHTGTCPKCEPWQGRVLSLTGQTPGYPTLDDAKAGGLFHPRCVIGDTIVSGPLIQACYSRWHEGQVVTIVTASGNKLTCTPNHPILTPEGWVGAGFFDIGDEVIEYVGEQRVRFGVNPDEVHIPTRIDNVACALNESRSVSSFSVPVASEDFHGDGGNGNVNIVRSNRFLWDDAREDPGKPFHENNFNFALVTPLTLSPEGFLAKIFECLGNTSGGFVGLLRKFGALFRSHSGEPDAHRFAPGRGRGNTGLAESFVYSHLGHAKALCYPFFCFPGLVPPDDPINIKIDAGRGSSVGGGPKGRKGKASLPQRFVDRGKANAESTCDFFGVHPGHVQVSDVVNVERDNFSGHVYNLQTEDGWYVSNGIITHNCRHASALYIPDEGETPEETERRMAAHRKDVEEREDWQRRAKEAADREELLAKRWTINPKKQARHIPGTKEYEEYVERLKDKGQKPSILTLPQRELQKILLEREGEWERAPGAERSHEKWRVRLNRSVGLWYDKSGKGPAESNLLIVVPSNTGTHVYPGNPDQEGQKR